MALRGPRGCTRVAVSAGLGSGFAFLMLHAVIHFISSPLREVANELLSIIIVGIGVVMFVEPLIQQLSIKVGATIESAAGQNDASRFVGFAGAATIFVLVIASLAHGLLHAFVQTNPLQAFEAVIGALLAPAWITYWWIWAVYHYRGWVWLVGAIFGAVWGGSSVMILIFFGNAIGQQTNALLQHLEVLVAFNMGIYALCGLAGGIAIDRLPGLSPVLKISISLVIALLIFCLLLLILVHAITSLTVLRGLSIVAGWSLGLMIVGQQANALLSNDE